MGDDYSNAPTVTELALQPPQSVHITNANGDVINDRARLMQRTTTNEYMVEVDEGDGVYRYYSADVEMALGLGGEVQVLAQSHENANATFDLKERVETVSGTSAITLDPRNVTVNYTDASGDSFSDALQLRDDGNYYFNLPNSTSNYGNFKVASLVDVDGNDILIKTVNGTGEVIIYYPLDSLNPLSVNVSTDANGPGDDGTPHSTINLTEVDREIRLRTPANPLAALDRAIAMVESKRSYLGAIENRLGSVIENQLTNNINFEAARSRIIDADYAIEMTSITRAQILQQSGTSVLAQANQIPQSVLSLLK